MKGDFLWKLALIFFVMAATFIIANFIHRYDNAIMIAEGICYVLGTVCLVVAIIVHSKRKQRETEERLTQIIKDFKKYNEDKKDER